MKMRLGLFHEDQFACRLSRKRPLSEMLHQDRNVQNVVETQAVSTGFELGYGFIRQQHYQITDNCLKTRR